MKKSPFGVGSGCPTRPAKHASSGFVMMKQRRIQFFLAMGLGLWTCWSLRSAVLLQHETLPILLSDKANQLTKKSPRRRNNNTPTSKKTTNLATASWEDVSLSNNATSAGFIHLGKTGGSNMARILTNGCHSFRPKPCKETVQNETMISKLVKEYFHLPIDTQKISDSNHSMYFLTSREPYQRFVSAFVYLHPANKKAFRRHQSLSDIFQKKRAYKCFKTLETFVDYIGGDPFHYQYHPAEYINSGNCTDLARAIVAGQVWPMEHMYNNYQRMLQWIPENKRLFIIRQEHLWEDWIDINTQYLGQKEPVVLPDELSRRNMTLMSNVTPPVTKDVGSRSRNRLCRALGPEYAAYFMLLQRAVNIPPEGVQEAVEMGQLQCPEINLAAAAHSKHDIVF